MIILNGASVGYEPTLKNLMFCIRNEDKAFERKYAVGGCLDRYGIFELCQPTPTQPPCYVPKIREKPLAYVREVEDKNHKILNKPPKTVPWSLPTEPEEINRDEQLYQEICDCIHAHLDLPNEGDYDVLGAWMFTVGDIAEIRQLTQRMVQPSSEAHGQSRLGEKTQKEISIVFLQT